MKRAVLIIGLLASISFSYADEVCVAQKIEDVGYVSSIAYEVTCKDGTFKTPKTVTTVLLPIPFKWEAKAKAKLSALMKQKGKKEVATIKPITSSSYLERTLPSSVVVFGKEQRNVSFCAVLQYYPREAGLNRAKVYSYAISCNGSYKGEHFSVLTPSDLNKYLGDRGYKHVLTAKDANGFKTDSILVFKEQN